MYQNGLRQGFGRTLFNTGEYYVGPEKDEKRNGFGKLVQPNGLAKEGQWHDNKFMGQ